MRCSLCAVVLVAISIVESGCAVLPHGHTSEATLHPDWGRVQEAARNAAVDPWVWAPLAGAAVFQIDHWDRRTSNWARAHTPIFGSARGAENWSDNLLTTSLAVGAAAVLAIPPDREPIGSIFDRHKGTLVELAALGATASVTEALKVVTHRERPMGQNRQSFPSGHASGAAAATRLAAIDLQSIDMDARVRRAADVGLDTMVIATGWARIEAGEHYPSDALAGIALGNFFATFLTQAFLGPETSKAFSLATTGDGALLRWQFSF